VLRQIAWLKIIFDALSIEFECAKNFHGTIVELRRGGQVIVKPPKTIPIKTAPQVLFEKTQARAL
jgi:hypothetical protein